LDQITRELVIEQESGKLPKVPKAVTGHRIPNTPMHLTLQQLRETIGGELLPASAQDAALRGRIVSDSRQVQPGDVFWALPGAVHNGADFADDAFDRGAAGVVLGGHPADPPLGRWALRVADPLAGLWKLAARAREQFDGQVVAVTGSVGKTTTRLMIDAVLATAGRGLTSPRNYNNHVGLPLSMLALASQHRHAVFELGASAAGEIGSLAGLCRPHVGVITCIGDAHLGSFGSREEIARAKTELLEELPADGYAVMLGDDPWLRRLAHRCRAAMVWIGRGPGCDLSATRVRSQAGRLSMEIDGAEISVPVWGRHHLSGVLAAVAVGRLFGIGMAEIVDALAGFEGPPMRCQVSQVRGIHLINDAYNASPLAMRAALELLRDYDAPGQRMVLCGDMRELGPASGPLHRKLGSDVVSVCGADWLLACGHHAEEVVCGARRAGMVPQRAIACHSAEEASRQLRQRLAPGDVALIKGSRALALERVVAEMEHSSVEWRKAA
jgi:UDP-N-acetylmuramoyl-tripeptide--D-alanyl-D-alanine ligase